MVPPLPTAARVIALFLFLGYAESAADRFAAALCTGSADGASGGIRHRHSHCPVTVRFW
ncbi:hypothetical protein J2S48_000722 [Promicromonospora iranensis]|uniref:Secreted protein n=1 Tax=Promicromonospora iranensis TaxID=1105144 RepID=A0ABU2CIN7_9MICO|nr:hypothetical protein [Promicromonospora iranensis]